MKEIDKRYEDQTIQEMIVSDITGVLKQSHIDYEILDEDVLSIQVGEKKITVESHLSIIDKQSGEKFESVSEVIEYVSK